MMTKEEFTTGPKVRGKPFAYEVDWSLVGVVGVSVAIGALLGASVALLAAPNSGEHTRLMLAREFRRRKPWNRSPWDALGSELLKVTKRRNQREGRERV